MKGGLPERIDPLHLADHRVCLEGNLPLRRFVRLKELLVEDAGEVRFSANFTRDESEQRIVELDLAASLKFACQRCMQPMVVDVSIQSTLALVEDEAEAERLGGRYEPLVVTGERMPLVEMLEDELLLRVPMIPKHEAGGDCQATFASVSPADAGQNPFAALAALKNRDTN
jgi:uncharacterized protein